jgi:enoyl-CoA hydratase
VAADEPPGETIDPGSIVTEVIADHVWSMAIARPSKYNGFTPEMMEELVDAYTRLDEDAELWVGVLHAHGPHFTAGLDLPSFADRMAAADRAGDWGAGRVDPLGLGRSCRKPIISAVKGITYTLGIELMLAGDIVIAAEDGRFSQLEPKRGLHAIGGATIRFVQRGGWGNAMYHLLTSDEFDAPEALRIGLVQEVVPTGSELDRALELAAIICEGAPLAVQATKASSRRYVTEGQAEAVAELGPTQARLAATEDFTLGVASFLEKRPARLRGH